MDTIAVTEVSTPLGAMVAAATGDALCLLEYREENRLEHQLARLEKHFDARFVDGTCALIAQAQRELDEYFAGARETFELPLAVPGTAFQRAAWDALRAIPYGETRTYADQARAIGRPEAVRAIGRANGDNRIAIVIPCHRVIGKDGSLTGYGGQMWRKKALLELEQRQETLAL